MKRVVLAGVALLAALSAMAGTASASAVRVCVPKREGSPILTPKHGKCRRGYKLTTLGAQGSEGKRGPEGKPGPEGKAGTTGFTSGELETLKALLPHIGFVSSGVAGKPTIEFSGVNVQIVSGVGKTNGPVNGEGNLVIGYDENPGKHPQTGSHNLILGEEQTFTDLGGIVAGYDNAITGEYASVTGGADGTASGLEASVTGGKASTASGEASTVSGGLFNTASGEFSSTSGGYTTQANAELSSAHGGAASAATGYASLVGGGDDNIASGAFSSVIGGYLNTASGERASVFGGKMQEATKEYEALL
jgi:hypothetical protein